MNFQNIPDELKFNAVWCCWKMINDKKLPFNPKTGEMAKSNDKNTFSSFKTALNQLYKYEKVADNGRLLGGLGLGIFNNYSAIDIDHCIDEDGKINELALDIIEFMKSYTEISPSKTGIRIIFKTDTRIDKRTHYIKNKNLEIYISDNTNKYVTITGNIYCNPNIINELNIDDLINKYMKKTKKVDIIDNFLRKDSKLKELWNSNAPGSGANENELDCALIGKLMFYFNNDATLVNQYFLQSPYYCSKDEKHKLKWDREDYRNGVFDLTYSNETYNPVNYIAKKTFDLTDTGNAHLFKETYGVDIRYNFTNKSWMVWNGQYWQNDFCNQIKIMVETFIENMKNEAKKTMDKDLIAFAKKTSNRSGKENLLNETQHLLPILNSQFDIQNDIINCKNGVLNLKTLELTPHNRELYLSKITDCNYIPNSKPKKFIKFLNEIFLNNAEKVNFIRKLFAYSFTGEISDQAFIIFFGEGSNGKSVLIEVINKILSSYCTTANKDLLIDKKFQNQAQSEVARLSGKRCIFISETESGDKLKEAFVKDITGGNEITARFLYANEFTFKPNFTPILITNHLPIINAADSALIRRLYPVDFSRIFTPQEQNINLIDELLEEKDEIFSWIADANWYKGRLKRPKFIEDNIKYYQKEMDIVQKWLDEWCVIDDNHISNSTKLFKSFNEYCKANKLFELNSTLFGRNMSKKFTKGRNSQGYYYKGVGLR